MLSDEVYEKLIKRLTDRIDNVNSYILEQIGESLKELDGLSPSKAQQLVNMIKYGGDYNKILKELSRITKLSIKDIDEIFEEVAKSDYSFAKKFYDYRKKRYIPYEDNNVLKTQVESLKRITEETFINFANTKMLGYGIEDEKGNIIFKSLKDAYYDILDEKVLSISTGQETYSKALKKTIESIGESGLKVYYKDGYSRRLDSTIRLNLNDSLHNLHNKIQEIIGEDIDSDGVEITAHINPAPDHALLQGRQFSNKEYKKLNEGKEAKAYDGVVIPKNDKRRAISTYNCYHTIYSIVLGVEEPNYSKEQLDKIMKDNEEGFIYEGKHYTNYEGTQMQRALELKIRQERDKITLSEKAKSTDLEDIIARSKKKIRIYQKKRRELQKLIFGGK